MSFVAVSRAFREDEAVESESESDEFEEVESSLYSLSEEFSDDDLEKVTDYIEDELENAKDHLKGLGAMLILEKLSDVFIFWYVSKISSRLRIYCEKKREV
jgi:hypothetical protein